jgi:RHS repeat-associated protein
MGIDTTVSGSTATNTLAWQHANIWAGGKLLGTYDKNGLHFYFDDPLGTRRAQTDYAGVLEQTCASLPYGDLLSCTGGDLQAPTEHHFTGKERDAESGNDYFGARYYSSNMGRFMSPDWSAQEEPVPYAKLDDPQSLNLYSYVANHPTDLADPDGHQMALPLGLAGFPMYFPGHNIVKYPKGYNLEDIKLPTLELPHIEVPKLPSLEEVKTDIKVASVFVTNMISMESRLSSVLWNSHNQTGSYTNTHASGKKYHGKGDLERAQQSGREKAEEHKDPLVSTDWTPAANDREAFKDESRRLKKDGGHRSSTNYNKRDSPGTKYREQDGSH